MDLLQPKALFRLFTPNKSVIFTDEKQLERIIEDPDKPLYEDEQRGYSLEKRGFYDEDKTSLMSICKDAAASGSTVLEASYDFFYGGTARTNYPSSDTTVRCFKVIHDAAKEHGMGFSASILNPLDIGGGYAPDHDETGFTYQFRETEILPDGSYNCEMLCQKQWTNNKGPIHLQLHKLLCFAFHEQRVENTPYFSVDPDAIIDISDTVAAEIHEDTYTVSKFGYGACKMHFRGKWDNPTANRALCVVVYRTPELDYFADGAPDYCKQVLDQHNAAGITYDAFYSDEMHIQFDWDQNTHFGETEITTRYITPNLCKKYAALYGAQYLDFPKYLVYMAYHQHDFLPGEEGKENAQHVFAPTEDGIYRTWLFRNRYFELLQSTVVKLCMDAKDYAESLWGGPIQTLAHATWQESPTCDHVYREANEIGGYDLRDRLPEFSDVTAQSPAERRAALEKAKAEKAKALGISRYDYTPWYDWSSSIRENTAACYDYFKWNEYFTGGGNDFAEGGYLDRNYYGQAMAASMGSLNSCHNTYAIFWGMPNRVRDLCMGINHTFGSLYYDTSLMQDLRTRQTDVLALYPIELNNVEERFGSWMVQYGYCNYITEEKLLENAVLTEDGCLQVRENRYRALMVLFEPLLSEKTLDLLRTFVERGGKVLWMSIYPVLSHEGGSVLPDFCELFGIASIGRAHAPQHRKGETVRFIGTFAGIDDMEIPTDWLVDAVYPFEPAEDAEPIAMIDGQTAAVVKRYPSGGMAVYAGFRVRDDQSQSLGKDVDTLYRVLLAMDAYQEGSLEIRSREPGAKLLMQSFANGTVTAAPHFREVYEAWDGTFFREEDYDAAVLAGRELPDRHLQIDEEIRGHHIRFSGEGRLAYRYVDGKLAGLLGCGTTGICIDGTQYTLSDRPAQFDFALVSDEFYADGISKLYMVTCHTEGAQLSLPVELPLASKAAVCGADVVSAAEQEVPFTFDGRTIQLTITPELCGKRIVFYC